MEDSKDARDHQMEASTDSTIHCTDGHTETANQPRIGSCIKLTDNLKYGGPSTRKDKGYAWCVLIMSFLSHFTHTGFTYGVVGNLTIAHKDFFNIDLQQSSLIGTVHTSLLFMFAPIASVMVKKIGCRSTQIFGGVCVLLGLGLSSLASKQWHAILLFGVLSGVGVSSTYISSSAILPYHFGKHRRLAFAFVSVGTFIGTAVWPILSQHLIAKYNYSKAMGIMASLQVLHVCAGVTFCQPSEIVSCDNEEVDDVKLSQLESASNQKSVTNDGGADGAGVHGNGAGGGADGGGVDGGGVDGGGVDGSGVDDGGTDGSGADDGNKDIDIVQGEGYTNNALDEEHEEVTADNSSRFEDQRTSHSLKRDIVTLLKSAKVWMLLINCMLWNAGNGSFHVLINDYMVNQTPLSVEEVALGITILGIAKVIGSLLTLATSPLKFDRLNLHFAAVIVYSLMSVAVPFCGTKGAFYATVAIWGAAFAMSIGNLLAVVLELCGAELLAMLFGLELVSEGLGSLIGIPLLTLLSVQTKPEYGMVVAGCVGVCGSLVLLPEMINRLRRKKC